MARGLYSVSSSARRLGVVAVGILWAAGASAATVTFQDPTVAEGDTPTSTAGDVVEVVLEMDPSTGDWSSTWTADAAHPFTGDLKLLLRIYNARLGALVTFPEAVFSGVAGATELSFGGNDPYLAYFSACDVLLSAGDTFHTALLDLDDVGVTNRDVIAQEGLLGGGDSAGVLVDVAPDTLNVRGHGRWVTAYITPASCFSVTDIDPSTVRIAGLSGATCAPTYEQLADAGFTPQIGDYDEDGLSDLTVKFDRQILSANLCPDDVAIQVDFELHSGAHLSGTDGIRVVDR